MMDKPLQRRLDLFKGQSCCTCTEELYFNLRGSEADATGKKLKHLAPVVQSIVSLTSSLRGQLDKSFTTYNQID